MCNAQTVFLIYKTKTKNWVFSGKQ